MELSWDTATVDAISQVGVGILGVIAIILISRKNKWGFVFGLVSQPFWFATTIINRQWGVFILSVVYAGCWIYGIHLWFFKDTPGRKKTEA